MILTKTLHPPLQETMSVKLINPNKLQICTGTLSCLLSTSTASCLLTTQEFNNWNTPVAKVTSLSHSCKLVMVKRGDHLETWDILYKTG